MRFGAWVLAGGMVLAAACGDDDEGGEVRPQGEGAGAEAAQKQAAEAQAQAEAAAAQAASELPDTLPQGLLLAYAQFETEDGRVVPRPGPARLEILTREGGQWSTQVIEDEDAVVFHKAMVYEPPGGRPGILTLSGTAPVAQGEESEAAAHLKLWRNTPEGWRAETVWESTFGGRVNRMRDAEIADVDGDGTPDIVVGTHDQGVVSMISPKEDGGFEVKRIDREESTFVHEIEIGDVNGDGVLEVYATPSEPNTLEGEEQEGHVVRYVPKNDQGRQIVADLGNRHAKEILVGDVDGDGKDELYVAVEALTEGRDPNVTIVEPVEIRRYDADTPADQGAVIATIDDRFNRFLTFGDLDGDGDDEMIAASFKTGLWLLEPGSDPRGEWSVQSIDRDSGGFEHAAIITDLDGDGTAELYVASDDQGEVRRYVWKNGRADSEVIHSREVPRSMMTWNIMPVPTSLLAPGGE